MARILRPFSFRSPTRPCDTALSASFGLASLSSQWPPLGYLFGHPPSLTHGQDGIDTILWLLTKRWYDRNKSGTEWRRSAPSTAADTMRGLLWKPLAPGLSRFIRSSLISPQSHWTPLI